MDREESVVMRTPTSIDGEFVPPSGTKIRLSTASPSGSFYIGSNVHNDSLGRPMCSFSGKLCHQRRMDGYGFCFKHILEDKSAPFKQCEFMITLTRACQNSVVLGQGDSRYCNPHKQSLGLIPKTDKKRPSGHNTGLKGDSNPSGGGSSGNTEGGGMSSNLSSNTQSTLKLIDMALGSHPEVKVLLAQDSLDLSDIESSFSDSSVSEEDFPWSLYDYSTCPFQLLPDDDDNIDLKLVLLNTPIPFNHLIIAQGGDKDDCSSRLQVKSIPSPMPYILDRQQKLQDLIGLYRMRLQMLSIKVRKHQRKFVYHCLYEAARIEHESKLALNDWNRRRAKNERLSKIRALEYARRRMELRRQDGTDSQIISKDEKAGHHDTPEIEPNDLSSSKSNKKRVRVSSVKKEFSDIRTLTPVGGCTFENCPERALPLTHFCYCHILNDPKQYFFEVCTFISPTTHTRCTYPIVKHQNPPFCVNHMELQMRDKNTSNRRIRKRKTIVGKDDSFEEELEEDEDYILVPRVTTTDIISFDST